MKNILLLSILFIQFINANDNYYYNNNQKIYLTPYNNSLRSSQNIDYYQNEKV